MSETPIDEPVPALRTPSTSWSHQGVVTAVAGVAAFTVGTFVFRVSSGMPGLAAAWPGLQPFLWAALVFGAFALLRGAPPTVRAVIAVLIAPIATTLDLMVTGGWPGLAVDGLVSLMMGWISVGMLAAALIGAIAGSVWGRAGTPASRMLLLASVSALVVGAALAFALPLQWLDVYFRLGGEPIEVSPAQGERYLATAGAALVMLVLAIVFAAVRRRAGMIWLTAIALALALAAAAAFQVPQGRFWSDDVAPAPEYTGPVCFGTTGDCPGG